MYAPDRWCCGTFPLAPRWSVCERIIQCGFWGQAVAGNWLGGQYERMSDPWMGVSREVNSLGQVYVSELALDAHLHLLEMGLVHAGKK